MFAQIVLDTNSIYFDKIFTYNIPSNLENFIQRGQRVVVPFGKGNKSKVGFVCQLIDSFETDYELKDIIDVIDNEPIVSNELIELAFFMQKKYMSSLNKSIKQILPPGKIDLINVYYKLKGNAEDEFQRFLTKNRSYEDIKREYGDKRSDISKLIKDDRLDIVYDIGTDYSEKIEEYVELLEYDLDKLRKNSIKQIEILNYLKENKIAMQKEVLKNTSSNRSSLLSLQKKGLIRIYKKKVNRNVFNEKTKKYNKLPLNKEQQEVFYKIKQNPNDSYLLKGVTGSGKTEIYLQLVEENLKKGKDSIILVPEISLTPQTIERFKGRFGDNIAIIHSRLNISERFEQRKLIRNGEKKIAIGARSAIFAPFKNLGLIVMDEEHDQSYISSNDPKYHTDEIAEFRQKYNNATLIKASATPSIESMKDALDGRINLVELNNRANGQDLPDVEIIDMRQELKRRNYSMISGKLFELITNNLNKKEQTILFLNKVGHTSFTFCRRCGYVIKCDACDVAMTYHKNKDKLICHYCGRTKDKPHICPNCGSKAIKEFGAGTEKLEEEIKELFPKARVLRMDSETTTKKGSYTNMYNQMKNENIDILIGTQMISKGLDFKNVTLVGLIAADLSLNIDGYISNEKTFQLITQVSGRSGRGDKKGKVIIQTYKPDNFVIMTSKSNDYKKFYEKEIKIRQAFEFPPYNDLVTIKLIYSNKKNLLEKAYNLKNELTRKNLREIRIFGPNPCKIERINNKYRYNILIKTKALDEFVENIRPIIKRYRDENSNISFVVSINPLNIN